MGFLMFANSTIFVLGALGVKISLHISSQSDLIFYIPQHS